MNITKQFETETVKVKATLCYNKSDLSEGYYHPKEKSIYLNVAFIEGYDWSLYNKEEVLEDVIMHELTHFFDRNFRNSWADEANPIELIATFVGVNSYNMRKLREQIQPWYMSNYKKILEKEEI